MPMTGAHHNVIDMQKQTETKSTVELTALPAAPENVSVTLTLEPMTFVARVYSVFVHVLECFGSNPVSGSAAIEFTIFLGPSLPHLDL